MSQPLKTTGQTASWVSTVGLLVAGDVAAFLLFVWLGRSSHALSLTDIKAVVSTAAPFIISWFAISPWFGLFRADVSRSWRKLLPRLLLAWVVIGGPLGLVFRALFLGRPLSGGIIPTFAAVTLTVTTLFLLIWRLSYAGWARRNVDSSARVEG